MITDLFIVLAIENKADGICIGVVGVHPKDEIDNEVEVLYGISDNYNNKGYATETTKALIQWIFENNHS
jgi:ribosomal-protein-alanine N-acetyltransferase